jgi:hypothetical protein
MFELSNETIVNISVDVDCVGEYKEPDGCLILDANVTEAPDIVDADILIV